MPEFAECCGWAGFSEGIWSERRDLNSGPPVPQTGALTGLRYAPTDAGTINSMAVGRNTLRDMPMKSRVLVAMRYGRPSADGSFWITALWSCPRAKKLDRRGPAEDFSKNCRISRLCLAAVPLNSCARECEG